MSAAKSRAPAVVGVVLVAIGLAAGGWLWWGQGAAGPAPAVPAAAGAGADGAGADGKGKDGAVADDAPQPASGELVAVETPAEAGILPENCIAYPDGSRLPPLNGVEKAPRIAFHRAIPFSPVIGKRTDAHGTEWYVHENGAMSTTRYQLKNGVREAIGELQKPVATTTVLDH
ncbi:MAG: hypothetical protein KDE27_26560 [Planctomycetes bacterium]|nr:hypothetical protein [Planctomycetota bacterium]